MLRTLLCILFVTCVYGTCSNGYEDIGDGICYKTFATPSLRREAETFCENEGGSLVQPQNAFVNAQIQREAQGLNSHVWLGLTCSGTAVTSCTYSDGNQVNSSSYTHFVPGHPNPGFGRCVYLAKSGAFSGKWISGICEEEILGFGCQIPSNATATSCGSSYREYNGFCYKVLPPSSNSDSEAACEVECAHLTSIHTQAENEFVRSITAQQSTGYYARVGLQLGTSGNYEWVDGTVSPQADYNNFGHSEPALGSCVGMALRDDEVKSGKWINTQCASNITSVCKRAKVSPCLSFYVAPTQFPSTELPNYVSTLAPSTCPSPYYLQGNGTIFSPGYPNYYTSGLQCEYVVAAPTGYIVYFSLNNTLSDGSSYIDLYNSITDSSPFASRVRDNAPRASTSPSMKITFNSETSNMYRWSGSYEAVDLRPTGCNQGVISAPGTISSPNHPGVYPVSYTCNYQLETVFDKRISLHFGDFFTESCCDKVYIYDGPDASFPSLGSFYGNGPSQNITTTHNQMYIQFRTDGSAEYRGFSASFLAV